MAAVDDGTVREHSLPPEDMTSLAPENPASATIEKPSSTKSIFTLTVFNKFNVFNGRYSQQLTFY